MSWLAQQVYKKLDSLATWTCTSCGAVNAMSRSDCEKCGQAA